MKKRPYTITPYSTEHGIDHAPDGAFKLGDVISMTGPSVPLDLRDKYFVVMKVWPADEYVGLSHPFKDEACLDPYWPACVKPWLDRQARRCGRRKVQAARRLLRQIAEGRLKV